MLVYLKVDTPGYLSFLKKVDNIRETIISKFPCKRCGFCCGLNISFPQTQVDQEMIKLAISRDNGLVSYRGCPNLKNNICSKYDSRPQLCVDFPVLVDYIWSGEKILGIRGLDINIKNINHCYISNGFCNSIGKNIKMAQNFSPPYYDYIVNITKLEDLVNPKNLNT